MIKLKKILTLAYSLLNKHKSKTTLIDYMFILLLKRERHCPFDDYSQADSGNI